MVVRCVHLCVCVMHNLGKMTSHSKIYHFIFTFNCNSTSRMCFIPENFLVKVNQILFSLNGCKFRMEFHFVWFYDSSHRDYNVVCKTGNGLDRYSLVVLNIKDNCTRISDLVKSYLRCVTRFNTFHDGDWDWEESPRAEDDGVVED